MRARLRLFGVEAGIDQDVAPTAADQPDKIIEVQRRGLVRIGDQKIHVGGTRRHRRIAQRIDFVGISHRCHLFLDVSWMRGLADPRQQAIVIRKGQTRTRNDGGMTEMRNVRGITVPSTTSSARCEHDPHHLSSGSPNSEADGGTPTRTGTASINSRSAADRCRSATYSLHSSSLVAVNCRN